MTEQLENNTIKDGVHDISNEQYHAASAISRSKLMLLDKSPYHYWYEMLSGKATKKGPTSAMILGSAFHTLMLEPDKFSHEFSVLPALDRRTSAGKEIYARFNDEHGHKSILTADQYEQINTMVTHVKKHDIVNTLLNDAVFEQSIFWTDEETGLQFKTRPDVWSSNVVVDIKTSREDGLPGLERSSLRYGYYLQAGMAFEACRAIGRPFEIFLILCCEKEEPWVPSVYVMKDEALQFGIGQFISYKNRLKECLDSDKWPGYQAQELGVPKYAVLTDEEE